jgi:hypothetical protein
VQKLFELVRKECSPGVWSRAQAQARTGQLSGKRNQDGSLELRMATKGGMIAPLVTLDVAQSEWTCECPSNENVCHHVAAAVIALAQAEREGHDLLGVRGPAGRIAYELTTAQGELSLQRVVKTERGTDKLTARLIEERQKGDRASIITSRADIEIEVLLGSFRDGSLPRPLVPKLLEWIGQCDDVTLDGKPIRIGEPVHPLTAKLERLGEGFRLIAGANPALKNVCRNGAALCEGKLCALREIELSEGDLAALKRGRTFEHQEIADLVGRVLPTWC